MEGEATDHSLIVFFILHWNGAVVILLKNIPVSEQETQMTLNNTNITTLIH